MPSPFKMHMGNAVDVIMPLMSHVFGSIPIPAVPPFPPQSTTAKPAKQTGLQCFRSLSILRLKKSKHPAQPDLATSLVKSPKYPKVESAVIAQRKQYVEKKVSAKPPPSLPNELALMQFIEGGSIDDNVKRLMEAVGGVEKGGIWYDANEEMEYVHLLLHHSLFLDRTNQSFDLRILISYCSLQTDTGNYHR